MANPVFTAPVYTYDEVTKLHYVTLSVDGVADKASGVGDNKHQAKRNACAKYMHDNEIDYLGIPDDVLPSPM